MTQAPTTHARLQLSHKEYRFALELAVVCLISYVLSTDILSPFVGRADAYLAGMWATIGVLLTFRPVHAATWRAGTSLLAATLMSGVLCLAYLLMFPFHAIGLAALLGLGTLIALARGRPEQVMTSGIATAVIMVVAAMGTRQVAWHQPLLRFVDIFVGVAVTVAWSELGAILRMRPIRRAIPGDVPVQRDFTDRGVNPQS